jgi:hypothetical protein
MPALNDDLDPLLASSPGIVLDSQSEVSGTFVWTPEVQFGPENLDRSQIDVQQKSERWARDSLPRNVAALARG